MILLNQPSKLCGHDPNRNLGIDVFYKKKKKFVFFWVNWIIKTHTHTHTHTHNSSNCQMIDNKCLLKYVI